MGVFNVRYALYMKWSDYLLKQYFFVEHRNCHVYLIESRRFLSKIVLPNCPSKISNPIFIGLMCAVPLLAYPDTSQILIFCRGTVSLSSWRIF
jgi:hypothetical protein